MDFKILAAFIAAVLPLTALAADTPAAPPQGWTGSGELGLAIASGNSKSENLNTKLDVKYNDARWKDDFYVLGVRNKSNVTTTVLDTSTTPPTALAQTDYQTTANRYEAGASGGYKLEDRSYLVGAVRYEHDDFAPYEYQSIVSLGYGFQALKNPRDELSFEVGAGYKVVQPVAQVVTAANDPSTAIKIRPDTDTSAAARGKVDYKHNFNANTSFVNSLLVESSSANTFVQNDASVAVKVTDKLALKVSHEIRYNSDVAPGFKRRDQLLTTNLVYGF
ncbi:MAG TPA: DUF481 domain-containing protein [Rudaea sp.]